MCETSLSQSKKNKKQDKQEENMLLLLVTAAAAVGDPHSLVCKLVTLDTSQSPMGWLNCSAFWKAALGAVGFEPTTTNVRKETIENGVKKERRNRRQKERSGREGGGA